MTLTITEAARCACPYPMRQIESDQSVTCVVCSRIVRPAPTPAPLHLDPEPARPNGFHRLGRRQRRVFDYIAQYQPCSSRQIAVGLLLSDGEVLAAVRSLTVRRLLRRDNVGDRTLWSVVA